VPALGRTFEGRVARLSDDLDRQTRTMETEIDVRNADDSLVAGMYAETVLELLRKDSALTVPVQAVARNGAVATVLVVGKDDRLEQRSVKIGLEGTRRLEILAGLENGERVVVGSRGELRVGEKVAPKAVEESRDSDGGL
jgi:RND family efflux transporter MFP subunit